MHVCGFCLWLLFGMKRKLFTSARLAGLRKDRMKEDREQFEKTLTLTILPPRCASQEDFSFLSHESCEGSKWWIGPLCAAGQRGCRDAWSVCGKGKRAWQSKWGGTAGHREHAAIKLAQDSWGSTAFCWLQSSQRDSYHPCCSPKNTANRTLDAF